MDEVREGAILRWNIHASSSTWRILYALRWGYPSRLEPAELLLYTLQRFFLYVNTIFSSGNKRSYNDFKENISPQIQPLFDSLRDYCFSLGSNVIEDVRMHRVVFCKSITFRWFVDMEPEEDTILLKIQRNRKEPLSTIKIKADDNLDQVKEFLRDAYITIR